MNVVRLGLRFTRHGGLTRLAIQAASVAFVVGLVLVALAVLRFDPDAGFVRTGSAPGPFFGVSNLLTDGGVRPGYVFALALICLVPLTLFQQAVRLGSAVRGRRFAQLRLAGASPLQLLRIGAVESAVPAVVGALLGWPAYLLLRHTLGVEGITRWASDPDVKRELVLVPLTDLPWWQVLAVMAVTVLAAVVLGTRADPTRRSPNPWPALALLVLGGLLIGYYPTFFSDRFASASAFLAIGCGLAAVLLGARWAAWAAARVVSRRAQSAALLLAASQLTAESGRAGRAGATIGAIALVGGGAATLSADLVSGSGNHEAMYVVPTLATFAVITITLVVMTFALAMHSVEAVNGRRRSLAALAAEGAPLALLERALRWETALVALPVSVIGLFIGGLAPAPFMGSGLVGLGVRVGLICIVFGLIVLGTLVSVRMVRPWLLEAVEPANLRAT